MQRLNNQGLMKQIRGKLCKFIGVTEICTLCVEEANDAQIEWLIGV